MRQHIYKKHKNILKSDVHSEGSSGSVDDEEIVVTSFEQFVEDECEIENSEHPSSLAGQFILKTRDGRTTQTTLNGIIDDTKIIIEHSFDTLEETIMKKLEESSVSLPPEIVSSIRDTFSSNNLRNPFQGLETEYKQVMRLCTALKNCDV